jgi:lipoyl(octanoyl) transferase
MSPDPEVIDLGRAPFAATHERMLRIAEAVRKREVEGKILLVEHEPVYTAGRATRTQDLPADTIPVERGGQVTYHGPGQLVVYPVIRLPSRDARAWLRSLERLGVAVCGAFGLAATASDNGTGVFVDGKKVISIGVAIRRWISLHGLAINVDMDLAAFHRIRPCGLDPAVMTDLSRLAGRRIALGEVAQVVRAHAPMLQQVPATPACGSTLE